VVRIGVKSYDSKVVVSGNIVEIYEYEHSIITGFSNNKSRGVGRSSVATDDDKKRNRELVLNRARRDLRRLINSNIHMYGVKSKFVTLTFADNITDIKKANYEFKKFKQRLETYFDFRLKYTCVIEFQKRGAIHYHVVFFNMPYIKKSKLAQIWGNGFIKVNNIDNVDNVGAYVCKYMSKNFIDDERLRGHKCYFSSRNLYKPIEVKDKKRVKNIIDSLPSSSLTYCNMFENEYNNTLYKQYNLNIEKSKQEVRYL